LVEAFGHCFGEYRVRYDAWYRHIALAMWAHAFLAVTAQSASTARRPDRDGLIPVLSATRGVSWHT